MNHRRSSHRPDGGPPGRAAARRRPADRLHGRAGPGTGRRRRLGAGPQHRPDDAAADRARPTRTRPSRTGRRPGRGRAGNADRGSRASSRTPPTRTPAGTPTPTPSGRSGGQSGGEGSEVAPPESQDRSPGDSLGDTPVPSAGRLSPAQKTGSAAGLVPGFPDDVVLVPSGATVASSSVTGADGRYQVTLDAAVDGACTDVLLDYRVWFTPGASPRRARPTVPGRTTVELDAEGTAAGPAGHRPDPAGCEVTVFAALSARCSRGRPGSGASGAYVLRDGSCAWCHP